MIPTRVRRYFERIGYDGSADVTLETLAGIIRAHVLAIPFDNIDVQLGVPLDTDPDRAFDKLVTRRRGGWCYEQNGVLGAMLDELGFDVTRVVAGVMQHVRGDRVFGNHLSLVVTIDADRWIADAGFGSSLLAPIPLQAGKATQLPFDLRLEHINNRRWRLWQTTAGKDDVAFDLFDEPADEQRLSTLCATLQTAPESTFVNDFLLQFRTPDEHHALRGRKLSRYRRDGVTERTLASVDDFRDVLRGVYRIDIPHAETLWSNICKRHEAMRNAP